MAYISNHIVEMVVPSLYDFYGFDDSDTSEAAFFQRFGRMLGIETACKYGYSECITNAVNMYANYMKNPDKLISSSYRQSVYCTAIRYGGVAEWDFAFQQFQSTDSFQHQQMLRYGMSCSNDAWVINRYIDYVLDPTVIRKQDQSATFGFIGEHETNKYLVWAYAVNNWDKFADTYYDSQLSMLDGAVKRFSTAFDMQLIDDLREVAGPAYAATMDGYAYTVQQNNAWRMQNEAKLAEWFGTEVYTSPSQIQLKPDTKKYSPYRMHCTRGKSCKRN
jgi:aminopeptidase N